MTGPPLGSRRRALVSGAWWALAVVAGALAVVAIANWLAALVAARPVLYGEGAVANAALLLREGSALLVAVGTEPYHQIGDRFVAANYPPLFFAIAALGDPFVVGRAVSIASVAAIGWIVVRRALTAIGSEGGSAGPSGSAVRTALPVGAALGLLWLATTPVAIWGAAVKPDLFALALTVGAVVLLGARGGPAPMAAVGGALLAMAVWSKPTALLPALAIAGWLLVTDSRALARSAVGALAVLAIATAHAATLGLGEVWRHVVIFNALPWHLDQALLLLALAILTFGISIGVAVLAGGFRGIVLAYGIGALAVAVLGGRDGATINYLLDLAAATSLALAGAAQRLRTSAAYPLAGIAQLAIATFLLAPFGIVPGREPTTGAWGSGERGPVVAALVREGSVLAEDSGLLIAAGSRPFVDDLFLWSRLVEQATIDPTPVLARVRAAGFVAVVSETDLDRLDAAPAYERARWHPLLVAAVLDRYRIDRVSGDLWIYRPK